MIRKGIILAGGCGSRLYPLTLVAGKQLQPVYDKPMIYYPLSTLMIAGVREICIVSTPQDTPRFETLLGDGRQWGLSFTYRIQPEPKGIAQAFLVAEDFIAGDPVALILGDNIFHGHYWDAFRATFGRFNRGGHVFAYRVRDPERYGVIEFDADGRVLSVEEKPARPRSPYAIPGLYLFDDQVVPICKSLKPSARGELEITDVIRAYLGRGQLTVTAFGRGMAWLDSGTSRSLHEASAFIAIVEERQGTKIACPEEIALRAGLIDLPAFRNLVAALPKCQYADYLRGLIEEFE